MLDVLFLKQTFRQFILKSFAKLEGVYVRENKFRIRPMHF